MKAKKATASAKVKKSTADQRSRKMEPLKSKEMKNQHFDMEDSEEMDPEALEENFKEFEENIENFDDDDDDY